MTRSIRAVLIFSAFIAITIFLTWFWTAWGREHYGYFLKAVAPPLYEAIGFGDARVGAFRQRYINFVPFIGLVVVTPGLRIRRRLSGLFVGLFALFIGHLSLNLTERGQQGSHLPFVPSLVSDVLPFVFWIIVAFPVISGWFASVLAPPQPSDKPGADETGSPALTNTPPGTQPPPPSSREE